QCAHLAAQARPAQQWRGDGALPRPRHENRILIGMKVAIIDYGSGNLRSAAKAFERAAREADLSADIVVTSDPQALRAADRIVLPGVGAFGDCAAGLRAVPGMEEALNEAVRAQAKPFFGICVGMQLMAER